MHEALWSFAGAAVGAILSGLFMLFHQKRQHSREDAERARKLAGEEHAKSILEDMLNHRRHIERSWDALSNAVGFSKPVVVRMLHELEARPTRREDGTEWWYLDERAEERLQKRAGKEP